MLTKTPLAGLLAFAVLVGIVGAQVHPPLPSAPTTTSTTSAHSFNGTMTVTFDDGTTQDGTIAISGNETLTHSISTGNLLSGEFKFNATINGKSFSGTAKARIGSGRYYRGSFTCPETGIKVKFSVLIGHPEGSAGRGTYINPEGNGEHGFGFGTGSFSNMNKSGPAGVFGAN